MYPEDGVTKSASERRSGGWPWNESWNRRPRNSSAISASGAIRRAVCAGHGM